MSGPLDGLVGLVRLPGSALSDLATIAQAVRSVPAMETMLAEVLVQFESVSVDLERVRETVEPQQKRVSHIESMVGDMQPRLSAMERELHGLTVTVEALLDRLPDAVAARGPLAKAKTALTGERSEAQGSR